MTLSVVILAAGQGKRMHSQKPKVLHHLAGKPLLEHVVETAMQLHPAQPPIVIYGHGKETVRQTLAHLNVTWIEQTEQLGTGHALQQALPQLPKNHRVLVLCGDVPLITAEALKKFINHTPTDDIGMITAEFPDPTGLGRILRDAKNNIIGIVEEKDANQTQRALKEINAGIYLIPVNYLQKWLPNLKNHNTQKEYYLTDIISLATQEKIAIYGMPLSPYEEVLGINDCMQLATAERFYQRRYAENLMRRGITLYDPNRFDVRGELTIGRDVVIDINVIIEGNVKIGNHCMIGPNTILRNTTLSDHVEIKANCVIDGAEIAEECIIGPFARIRPGTIIAARAQIGNFAEIKNSVIGAGTKSHHVSYIGDSEIGKHVNIGAGTITCNYDGTNKHRTVIGDNAFVGSNSTLVAPLSIGEKAYIGAGSTITRNAPQGQLTVGRAKQRSIENWTGPGKKTKETKET